MAGGIEYVLEAAGFVLAASLFVAGIVGAAWAVRVLLAATQGGKP